MPELPEVQTILNDLRDSKIIGRTITNASVYWSRTVATPDVLSFCQQISHQTIQEIERRGKYLILNLSSHLFVCIHLRMTGRLLLVPKNTPETPYIRLRLDLDNDQALFYHDTRKFGRWSLVSNPQDVLAHLGPEPLNPSFSDENFWQLLHARSRALKPLLLDQTFVSGLGNIYVDEALWEAHLHPLQAAHLVTKKQSKKLLYSMRHVLQRGIDSQGTTLGTGRTNYYRLDGSGGHHQTLLNVFRRTGEPCPRCQIRIERIIVAQRSTHFCPNCQQINFS
jgi:formamidopyrimidine-DNA glycosylase